MRGASVSASMTARCQEERGRVTQVPCDMGLADTFVVRACLCTTQLGWQHLLVVMCCPPSRQLALFSAHGILCTTLDSTQSRHERITNSKPNNNSRVRHSILAQAGTHQLRRPQRASAGRSSQKVSLVCLPCTLARQVVETLDAAQKGQGRSRATAGDRTDNNRTKGAVSACALLLHVSQTASPALQGRLALAWLLQLLVAVLPRPGAGEALSSLQPYDTTCAAGTNCSTDTCAPQSRRWMLLLEPLHNDCGLPALAWQITQGGARLHPPPCAGPATQGR